MGVRGGGGGEHLRHCPSSPVAVVWVGVRLTKAQVGVCDLKVRGPGLE